MQSKPVRIGTRGSALALAQAHEVRDRLAEAHQRETGQFEIVVISTRGDRILDRPLAELGGKGLFTQEIEERLDSGDIDMAVHSSKDMPTRLPDGLMFGAFLQREDVRDAFISPKAGSLAELRPGSIVGTASLRRQAMVKRLRPDVEVVSYRGNVQTRLKKLAEGEVDATLLAFAGLRRLGLEDQVTSLLETDMFLPAVGQGAICVETRRRDERIADLLGPLHDEPTAQCLAAERAMLAILDGSCRTPIAGLAECRDNRMILRGQVLLPDGSQMHESISSGPPQIATTLGSVVGEELKELAGPEFLARLAAPGT